MKKIIIITTCVIIFLAVTLGIYWILYLQRAHSTFENYYNFRGCIQLIEKTDTYGLCKISSGEVIKIVQYDNKWFLAGDLPSGATVSESKIEYINTEYGFIFSLPVSWKGYSIVKTNWEGSMVDIPEAPKITGTEISIRHPLWTKENPRQDIPIMIFTPFEWNLVQQEKLSLSAAPIGPSLLASSTKNIFAIPARYNFAFPTGFEEVDQIIQNKPLTTF
jgi:hypothetical protein